MHLIDVDSKVFVTTIFHFK